MEIESHPAYGVEDCGKGFTPELRAKEEQLCAEIQRHGSARSKPAWPSSSPSARLQLSYAPTRGVRASRGAPDGVYVRGRPLLEAHPLNTRLLALVGILEMVAAGRGREDVLLIAGPRGLAFARLCCGPPPWSLLSSDDYWAVDASGDVAWAVGPGGRIIRIEARHQP